MKDGKKIENVSLISKTNVGYVSYKNSFDDKNNCDKRLDLSGLILNFDQIKLTLIMFLSQVLNQEYI